MTQRKIRLSYAAISKIMLIGFVLALLVATHLPPSSPFLPREEHNLDKVYHFTAYAILAGLLATVWQFAAGKLTSGHLRWAWFAVIIFAALDEITQIPVSRDCNIWDWLADAVGAAAGLMAFALLSKAIATRMAKRT